MDRKQTGPALSVQNLGKHFGGRGAFEAVTFKVGYGEGCGILGPTDAGKDNIRSGPEHSRLSHLALGNGSGDPTGGLKPTRSRTARAKMPCRITWSFTIDRGDIPPSNALGPAPGPRDGEITATTRFAHLRGGDPAGLPVDRGPSPDLDLSLRRGAQRVQVGGVRTGSRPSDQALAKNR